MEKMNGMSLFVCRVCATVDRKRWNS